MKHLALLLLAVALWTASDSNAVAQVPYVTYYQPVTVCSPAPFYSPAPVFSPAPVYYSSYYAPAPVPVFQPVTRVRTRYRPILGGTVTRVRSGYAPAYYPPAPVVYAY